MEEIIFPNKLRSARKAKGVGMQEIADLLGVSLSAISKIERGYRRISQEQMIKIIEFLNCTTDDIFISKEKDEDQAILEEWKKEAEKRISANENSGLKVFGAGLRELRKERKINLADFAKQALMTVSVYHRVEMGQREIYKNELASIAGALGMEIEDMVTRIKERSVKGELNKHLRKNQGEFKLTHFSDIANRGAKNSGKYKVPFYKEHDSEGNLIIAKNESNLIECPIYLEKDWHDTYAVQISNEKLGSLIPNGSIIFADKSEDVKDGDLAILKRKRNDGVTEIVIIKVDISDNKATGLTHNPEEKIIFDNSEVKTLDKISLIKLA
ncbi:MAG: helix-turn-helix transcriptional regulator [Alphaproteobacteria bacterium]|jgi:transcriptional regulator with XRE-family HTH domain|nr:helix-turn-helix transcriptional regulator [Alphaproteobacteria bacterium]